MIELKEKEVECRHCFRVFIPAYITDDYFANTNNRDGLCAKCLKELSSLKPPPQKILDLEHFHNVCGFHFDLKEKERMCRYSAVCEEGISCLKGSGLQPSVDKSVERMTRKGDNCSGPPKFEPRHKIAKLIDNE